MTRAPTPSLRQRVLEDIRAAILDGRYAPNSLLSENQLAEEYAISRTPIREALRELAAGGLLKILPKRGIVVTSLTCKDVMELYELREAIECFATRLTAARLTPADIEGFRIDQARTETLLAADDLRSAYASSILFHSRIMDVSRNARLRDVVAQVSNQVYRIGMLTLRLGRSATSIAEHREIIDALSVRDADRAVELMRAHLLSDRDVVLSHILPLGDAPPTT